MTSNSNKRAVVISVNLYTVAVGEREIMLEVALQEFLDQGHQAGKVVENNYLSSVTNMHACDYEFFKLLAVNPVHPYHVTRYKWDFCTIYVIHWSSH